MISFISSITLSCNTLSCFLGYSYLYVIKVKYEINKLYVIKAKCTLIYFGLTCCHRQVCGNAEKVIYFLFVVGKLFNC